MGYDLCARNKNVEGFHMGAFSWSWMLDAGVGLPVGYGIGYKPAMFVYTKRPDGLCVVANDGARITSKEAKQMAQLAAWIADYQDTLYSQWMKESDEARKEMEDHRVGLYNLPVRRDFVEKVRNFSEWAKKSGGFTIH